MGEHGKETRKGNPLFGRLLDVADPLSYRITGVESRLALKVLFAGFVGVAVGWVAQPFFSAVLALPYWWAYWPAVLLGFIVNVRSQKKMGSLNVKKK